MSGLRFWRRRDEVPVVELRRSNPVRFGIVLVVVIVVAVYFGFAQRLPFTHGYRLKAVFSSAQNIAPGSPVRIAGVPAGQVVSVQRLGRTGVVTMEISEEALPIHVDATLKIRPRLFLEGNWFVELRPGSPSAPTVSSGHTIPITQTADPVQLDQVLSALTPSARENLQAFLQGYGTALSRRPSAAEDATQTPEAKGLTGAEGLKEAARYGPTALEGTAIVQRALGGVELHDISKMISGIGRFAAALNVHERDLGQLVDNFDSFLGSLAAESPSLKAAVSELPGTLRSSTRAFVALRRALPSITSFSKAIVPGVEATPAAIAAATPWIEEVRKLLAPGSLGSLARNLSAATPSLASLISGQEGLFKQTEEFSKCLTNVFYPTGNQKIQDGAATSGQPAYREFWYSLVGLAGIGQNFDGNGISTRFLAGASRNHTIVSQPARLVGVKGSQGDAEHGLIAHAPLAPEGTSPAFPAAEPPYKPLVPCYTQKPQNLNAPFAHGPADGSGG